MKFAAIDVGSNAVRLLVSRIDNSQTEPLIKKEVLIRIPLRLGADVFRDKRLSQESGRKLLKTMEAFSNLIEVFQPLSFRACGTSAMRDAENGPAIVSSIAEKTGIELEIITGRREAEIIFSSHVERQLDPYQSYLFIDVGGGSTELMLYKNGQVETAQSFNVGGVRMLNDAVDPGEWDRMKQWVKKNVRPVAPLGIGSGGNINRLNRMAIKDERRPLTIQKLKKLHEELSMMTVEERIESYKLKTDRADVIVPAGRIYLSVMQWGGIRKIFAPKFGLSDGLIRLQYDKWCQENSA